MTEENHNSGVNPSTSTQEAPIIPGYTSIEQFTKNGFKTLMEAIKHSNALPSGRDWDFYNTSDSFKKIITDEGNNVMRIMNQVLRSNELETNIRNRVLDEKIELIVEANDIILEKVANNIDELSGIKKTGAAPVVLQTVSAQLPVNGSWNKPTAATFSINSTVASSPKDNCIKLLTAKNIVRPQKFFKDKIDNRNKVPWCPRINDKPNSLKPLAIFLEESDERQEFSHPYEYELDRFAPTSEQLLEEKPQIPKALIDTPLIEINRPEQLDDLVETLRSCTEFAIDVEHHSYRSFMGITCLLQISTQDKDYLIDTLALRDNLSILNEVFTRKTIVKIFHGADRDIEWLQRDLSIYVVNMFDTHQAAKTLQYQGLSLAFLLKKFCNVLPNKQFQLADWRIRPLPEELKTYAREDTHYLIYIYKMLKKELLAKANKSDNLLKSVIELSTEICKKRYFKTVLSEDSHLDIYRKCKKMFDNRQMYALKEMYAWRDGLAREEDESLGYVLPNHMLVQISETLPREMQGILACCNPIPPLVRSHLLELHHIILKARDQPLEKAIMKDTTGRGVLKKVSKVNVDSALHCPHDLSRASEFRDDLPTLLDNGLFKSENKNMAAIELAIEKSSSYSIFDVDSDDAFNERETFKKVRGFAYFSPYERYKLVKPFVLAEAEKEETEKEQEGKNVEEEGKNVEAERKDERTDDERIASVKDHFVQLSRKFGEELQAQKTKEEEEQQRERSLIEMGGSRKRRREYEVDHVQDVAASDFHSPLPNMSRTGSFPVYRRNKGRKRRFSEINDAEDQMRGGQFGGKKKNKKNTNNQQQHHLEEQSQQQQQQFVKKQVFRQLRRRQPQQQQQHQLEEQSQQQQQQNVKQRRRPPPQLRRRQPQQQQQQQHQLEEQSQQQQQQNVKQRRRPPPQLRRRQPQQQQQQQQQQDWQHPQQEWQHPKQEWQHPQQHDGSNQRLGGFESEHMPRQPKNKPKRKPIFQRLGYDNEQMPAQRRNIPKPKPRPRPKKNNQNQNQSFSPYDYASVDFRQFQGGAGSANKGAQIKQGFKAKNRKNKNNKQAKSSTFANSRPNQGAHHPRNY